VYYSLKYDNVHDFFTEYVPYGEEAVLYFEEREFRRRFHDALARLQPKVDSPTVTIPKSSGAKWRLADQDRKGSGVSDVGKPGPHTSSKKAKEQPKEREEIIDGSAQKVIPEDSRAMAKTVSVSSPSPPKDTKDAAQVPKELSANSKPLAQVELSNANDPVVQDLVNVINNIIKAVNDSGSGAAFETAIFNAKAELSNLNDHIRALKEGMERAVQNQLNEKDLEFAKAAQGLVTKVNHHVEDLEHQLREEFEVEREIIAKSYQRKLQTELERSRELSEQRLRNGLLEQAIEMKRQWVTEIEDRVERERNGRLGKLRELEAAVHALEKLTAKWDSIVSIALKTQKTFTAIEAVRASYESPEQPKPFLREMAALKEICADDELVRAAIASINPAAYQRGVSTHTMLVERFRKLADEVRRVALLPEDAGVATHAGNWILSKFMFKKSGLAEGNDVESILAKTETYLEEGDVDSAAREMNQLSGWARTLAKDWLREARLLLEVQQAVGVCFCVICFSFSCSGY
jgi:mitofilin